MSLKIDSIIEKIDEYIAQNTGKKAKTHCAIHRSDIAEALEYIKQLDDEKFKKYINELPKDLVAEAILELPDTYQEEIVNNASVRDLSSIVNELDTDDATDLIQVIEEQDPSKAENVLSALDKEHKEDIETLKRFKEDTAGSIMQFELVSAYLDERIIDTIGKLRALKLKDEIENIHYVFVTDRSDKLLYVISLEDLILIDFEKTFAEIKDKLDEPIYVFAGASTEEVAFLVEKYDLPVLPVVNERRQLIGRITSDDIYDLIEENATEQIYSLGGVHTDEELHDSVLQTSKMRILWLAINLLAALVTSFVISLFEGTLSQIVALAVLMPIIASMGGVAGTQTLTVVVRQIALGEIDRTNGMKIIKKELSVGLINGIFFCVIVAIVAFAWFGKPILGAVMAASLFVNLFIAAVFGSLIPMGLKHLKIDPAVASGMLLTTITDVTGFFSFLGLASLILL
ncbi:MAG: magnesium transporter [Helicobacteraceae bacterium]